MCLELWEKANRDTSIGFPFVSEIENETTEHFEAVSDIHGHNTLWISQYLFIFLGKTFFHSITVKELLLPS
jgi:hypothetical protein